MQQSFIKKSNALIIVYLISFAFLYNSCKSQDKPAPAQVNDIVSDSISKDSIAGSNTSQKQNFNFPYSLPKPNVEEQLSAFVRRIFQDSRGHLWFGTNGDGVIRYDGKILEYFSIDEGFAGVAVRGITEDKAGNIWFATSGGLSKFDGKSFSNYTENDGLVNNDIWSLLIDSQGKIWIGTYGGLSVFNGTDFRPFSLPETSPDYSRGVTSARIVHSIMEDRSGKLWFGTNGGAYIYKPNADVKQGQQSITHISEKDGLCNNAVNAILEDKAGNIWFATHHAGICRYNLSENPPSFSNFTKEGLIDGHETWSLFEDSHGNIWFPSEGFGLYCYNPSADMKGLPAFSNFQQKEGLDSNAIQCIYEDRSGRLWLGGWLGLFRFNRTAENTGGTSITPVTKQGPWD